MRKIFAAIRPRMPDVARVLTAIAIPTILVEYIFTNTYTNTWVSPDIVWYYLWYYLTLILAGLLGAYAGLRWRSYARLKRDFEDKRESEGYDSLLDFHTWWIAWNLRRRGFKLRTRADIILGIIFALLFGGILFISIAIPLIGEKDRDVIEDRIREIRDEANIERNKRFEKRFELLRKGRFWLKHPDLLMKKGESIAVATFSQEIRKIGDETAPGKNGVLAGNKGSVFVTQDSGITWSTPSTVVSKLKKDEFISGAAFSEDGKNGILVGNQRSVLVTQDGGITWKTSLEVVNKLKKDEFISGAVFSDNGKNGILAGNQRSVLVTQDGGITWKTSSEVVSKLKKDEAIIRAVFSDNGEVGVLMGDERSVLVTRDGGITWDTPSTVVNNLAEEDESIIGAAFSENGEVGILAGNEGSVFVTQNGGMTWSTPSTVVNNLAEEDESIIGAAFSENGKNGVLVGDEGSVFVTTDSGVTWRTSSDAVNNLAEEDESIITFAFSKNGKNSVLVGDKGSVFVTQDGGITWRTPSDVMEKLKEEEHIRMVIFSKGGKNGALVGNEGSVFITQNGGETWAVTGKDRQGTSYDYIFAAPENQYPYLGAGGEVHTLRKYPGLGYSDETLKEDYILKDSNFAKELLAFQEEVKARLDDLGEGSREGSNTPKNWVEYFGGPISQARFFAGIALFFLLHLLVRIYRYELRLANFWDSRADAILLADKYTQRPTATFDVLVDALAPDEYDFKPPRQRLENLFRRNMPPS